MDIFQKVQLMTTFNIIERSIQKNVIYIMNYSFFIISIVRPSINI